MLAVRARHNLSKRAKHLSSCDTPAGRLSRRQALAPPGGRRDDHRMSARLTPHAAT